MAEIYSDKDHLVCFDHGIFIKNDRGDANCDPDRAPIYEKKTYLWPDDVEGLNVDSIGIN